MFWSLKTKALIGAPNHLGL